MKFRPKVEAMPELDFDSYIGTWYQMYRVNGSVDWGDCSNTVYYKEYDKNGQIKDPYNMKLINRVFPRDLQGGPTK